MYEGAEQRIRSGGGSEKVAIASNVGQASSVGCAGFWVAPRQGNTGLIKMNIGAAATADLGIELNEVSAGRPLWVPLNDISLVQFYGGTDGDIIDITYLKG
jgi:hypothetical protein